MAGPNDDAGAAGIPDSDHFRYAGGKLLADGCSLDEIAARVGTPAYVYSAAAVDASFAAIDGALSAVPHMVAYAVKANASGALLARLARAGCGADIVSGGELKKALSAGFDPSRIVFSGVGKTDDEIRAALQAGIRSIHAESAGEIDAIEAIAATLGKRAPIAVRVNPDVDAKTHPYISTGLHSTKFGLELDVARELLPRLVQSEHLELEGVACHIGSMVLDPDPIGEAVEITARFARECKEAGAPITTVDAGGGWPILYGDEGRAAAGHATFGRVIIEALKRGGGGDFELIVEPGRSVVGDAGILLTRVLYTKQQGDKRFVIVDGSMTELIRPSLYSAYHAAMPIDEPQADVAIERVDLVGPVCESTDFLAKDRPMPPLSRGDLIAIRGAGAYCSVMASNYNGRPMAPEVLVADGEARVVRKRQVVEDIWRDEMER